MKHLTKKALFATLLLTTSIYAGGKTVAPVETEVIPASEDISPWYCR